jgi:hypothetical protein
LLLEVADGHVAETNGDVLFFADLQEIVIGRFVVSGRFGPSIAVIQESRKVRVKASKTETVAVPCKDLVREVVVENCSLMLPQEGESLDRRTRRYCGL